MHIVQIKALSNGAHPDLCSENIIAPPEGWAVIPEGFPLPASFPFADIQAEEAVYTRAVEITGEDGETVTEKREYTVLTVTAMTDGTLPEPVPEPVPEPESEAAPSMWDELDAAYQEGVNGAYDQ